MSQNLLEEVAQGRPGAVEECLDRFGSLVWGLARRWLKSDPDAEEVVQNVFADLWANASRYDPLAGSQETFVAMIARRRLIDFRRKQSRRLVANPLDTVGDLPSAPAPDPVETADEVRRAQRKLGELPEEQQRVLRMSILQGLSHQMIADRLDMPLGTVKTRIRRGIMKLRDALEDPAAERPRRVES